MTHLIEFAAPPSIGEAGRLVTQHAPTIDEIFGIASEMFRSVHSILEFLGPHYLEHPAHVDITQRTDSEVEQATLRSQWMAQTLAILKRTQTQVATFIESAQRELPGIGGKGPVLMSGVAYSSALHAASQAASPLIQDDRLRADAHALHEWSSKLDFGSLETQVQCELAALRRCALELNQHKLSPEQSPQQRPNLVLAVLAALEAAGSGGIQTLEKLAHAAGYALDSVKKQRKKMAEWMEKHPNSTGQEVWTLTDTGRRQLTAMRSR